MKIGIITEEVTNEDVAGALQSAGEQLGCEIVVIDQRDCTVHNFSSPEILYKGVKLEGLDACLVRGSLSNYTFRLYLIEYLEKQGTVLFNDAKCFDLCNDKFKTQTILNGIGVKTPDTVALVNIEQLDVAVKALNDKFPMIIKTVSGAHGVGVIKVDTFESLKSIVQLLLENGTELMLQEFIDHKESGRIMTLGDKVLAAMMRTIPDGDFRSNMTQGAELKAHTPSQQEAETAVKVAKALGCKISAIDYIISPEGEMVIFEANSSPGFKGIQSVNTEISIAGEVLKYIMAQLGDTAAQGTVVTPDVAPSQDGGENVPGGEQGAKDEEEEEESVTIIKPATDEGEALGFGQSNSDPDEAGEGVQRDEEEDEEEHSDPTDQVGLAETIIIKRINDNKPFDAKIDTGADRCSLGAEDIEIGDNFVKFKIDNTVYKVPLEKTVRVVAANGEESRPIVKFNVTFNDKHHDDVQFNIAKREGMKYQVIIGKNLLNDANVVVNPQK